MAIPKRALLASAVIVVVAMIAAACSSSTKDASSSSSASQSSIDELAQRVQQNEMLNAWVTISALPMHDLDTTLQGGKIDGKYVPTLRTLIRLLALTNWTSDVQPRTTQYHDDAVALFKAMNAGKSADELKDLSAALHEDADAFGPAVGNAVAKDLPADAGGPQPTATKDDGGTTTPGVSTATH